ncbi:15250_t:CDS:2 [Entrophospora sp. SA101]|nr:14383_t:CDS:2 [Entrophospora sp. SA101]CAJ0633158.1 15249_t:CDS:2 [Entrophospora sp. SA101]CAJ0633159.1 15250_t:CDS:2 [Entrophospora sp. SA101]CAJ0832996.1 917_t:CDS:2 [Entrophospora sp. SA101]CAJ0837910.1 11646_t:CDS:2 [Entrophospora sp. SA101]
MTNLSKSVIVTTTTAPNSSIRALIDDENGGGSYDFGYNNNCVYNDILKEEKMIENEAGSQGKEEYLYDCLQNN